MICFPALVSSGSGASTQSIPHAAGLVWVLYAALLFAGLVSLFLIARRLLRRNAAPSTAGGTAWQRRVQWLCSRPLTWRMAWLVCLILGGLQLAFLAFGRLAIDAGLVSLRQLDPYWMIIQGVLFHVAGLFVVALVVWRAGSSLRDIFGIRTRGIPGQAGRGAFFYLAALPVFAGATFAYHMALHLLGYRLSMQEVVSFFLMPQSARALLLHLMLAVVIAPVAEEVLFRGVALPLLAKSAGPVPAILISSLLFALVHFHLPSFVPLFVLSLAFSIAYIHTRGVLVPIVMHSLFNGVNLAFLMTLTYLGGDLPPI